jgi:hypothetical protein
MRILERIIKFFRELQWYSLIKVLSFSKEPIFIAGCERSGTTVLLAILGAHPHIFAIPFETNTYHYHTSKKRLLSDKQIRRKKIIGHLFKQKIKKSAKRFCEKTPRNILHINEILKDYNNKVKIIHIIRDGRDVVTSIHPNYPERKNFVTIDNWKERVGNASLFREHPCVITIKYEDLISSFEETIKTVLAFIEEPYHPNLELFHTHTNIKSHSAWKDGVKPIFTSSSDRYKKQSEHPDVKAFENDTDAMSLLKVFDYQ